MTCFKKCLLLALGGGLGTWIILNILLASLKISIIGGVPVTAFIAILAVIVAGAIVMLCYNKCK